MKRKTSDVIRYTLHVIRYTKMDHKEFEEIFELCRKFGGRYIFVENNKPNFVLMGIDEYKNIFDKEKNREEELKGISKEELIEKMNREIALWREAQREKEIEEIDEIVKKEDAPKDEESYYYDIENKLNL